MMVPLPPAAPPAPAPAPLLLLLRKRPHPEDTAAVDVPRTPAARPLRRRRRKETIVVEPEDTRLPTPEARSPRLPDCRRFHDDKGIPRDHLGVLAHRRSTHGVGFLEDDRVLSAFARIPAAAAVKSHAPSLQLDLGSFYVPKEGEHPQGEDAHFVNKPLNAFGIADGVGGWTEYGIDAGKFARELMTICEAELEAASCPGATGTALEGVLERAVARTAARGTSTACIAVVDGQVLRAVNMGDSGFLVVRGGKVAYHSAPQQDSFYRPYQVGRVDEGDPLELAGRIVVPIEPGDIIVAGTDGLFDNLFDAEILDVLVGAKADGRGTPQEMARAVAWAAVEAYIVGQETPFSMACREADVPWIGGKPDDVTAVVASVW